MKHLRTSPAGLAGTLSPLAYYLDNSWYYISGNGARFPIAPPQRVDGKLQGPDWERYLAESHAASVEYSKWLDTSSGSRIGIPGFFSRYADCVDFSWTTHLAADTPSPPYQLFKDFYAQIGKDYFNLTPEAPPEICLIARDVDNAYHDFFFRDDWAYDLILNHIKYLKNIHLLDPTPIPSSKKSKAK